MIPFTTYLGLISKCSFGEYWTQVGATAKQKAIICPNHLSPFNFKIHWKEVQQTTWQIHCEKISE